MKKRIKIPIAVVAILIAGAATYWISLPKFRLYHITGVVTEVYKSERGEKIVAIKPSEKGINEHPIHVLLGLRQTMGSELKEDQIQTGKRYTLMIFKPKLLETPLAWAARPENEN